MMRGAQAMLLALTLIGAMPAAQAFIDVSGPAQLAQMGKIYYTLIEQLRTLQAQSTTMRRLLDDARAARQTYDRVVNLRLESVIDMVKGDLAGTTLLDELDGASRDERLRLIELELSRRIRADTGADRARLQRAKGQIKQLQRLQAVQAAAGANLQAANTDLDERRSAQLTAQSTAMIAALASVEQQRRASEALQAHESRAQETSFMRESVQVYGALAEREATR